MNTERILKQTNVPHFISAPFAAASIPMARRIRGTLQPLELDPAYNTAIATGLYDYLSAMGVKDIFCPHPAIFRGDYGDDNDPEARNQGIEMCRQKAIETAKAGGVFHIVVSGIAYGAFPYISSGMAQEIEAYYSVNKPSVTQQESNVVFWDKTPGVEEGKLLDPGFCIYTQRNLYAEDFLYIAHNINQALSERGIPERIDTSKPVCDGLPFKTLADLRIFSLSEIKAMVPNFHFRAHP